MSAHQPDLFGHEPEKTTPVYDTIMAGLKRLTRDAERTNRRLKKMLASVGGPAPTAEKKSEAGGPRKTPFGEPVKTPDRPPVSPPQTQNTNRMRTVTIPPHVETVLRHEAVKVEGNVLFLNQPKLERKLYEQVNAVLAAGGGKWDKKAKGHVFKGDPMEKLGLIIEAGEFTKEKSEQQIRQAFYTPRALAARVVELAEVSGKTVLEPSAGGGALLRECLVAGARRVECVEVDRATCDDLVKQTAGHTDPNLTSVLCADFLTIPAGVARTSYDRVVMNPPFTKNQDVAHVRHALGFLAPRGRLVAIMWPNTDRRPFRELIAYTEAQGWTHEIDEVEAGAFKESGTNVTTLILTVQK